MASLKVRVILMIALLAGFVLSDEEAVGDLGEQQEADDNIQHLADVIRDVAETLVGVNYEEFTAVSYREQIVEGKMFFVKIQVSAYEFIHAKIYESLPEEHGSEIKLLDVETEKMADDEIEYF